MTNAQPHHHQELSAIFAVLEQMGEPLPDLPMVTPAPKERLDPMAFAHDHLTHEGKSLTLTDKPYLRALYKDTSDRITVQKSVQVGVSEWLICRSFWHCDNDRKVFYVVPKYGLRNLFARSRVQPTIQRNPRYSLMAKAAPVKSDSMQLLLLGNGSIYFASSETASDFDQYPANVAIVDDKQNCDSVNIAKVDDRLSASVEKVRYDVGIAEYPGSGVNADYLASDQKKWFSQCDHCGHWQNNDFFKHVVREVNKGEFALLDLAWNKETPRDIYVFCEKCSQPVDRLADGEWVSSQSHQVSGYQLSKMPVPTASMSTLWGKLQKGMTNPTVMQNLMNSDLAEVYVPDADFKMEDEILNKCRADYRMPSRSDGPCTMGVDVGAMLNVRISEWKDDKRYAVYIGEVSGFDALDELIVRYNVAACVVDGLPETHKVADFKKKYPKLVWACFYPNLSNENVIQKILPDLKRRTVNIDRTDTLNDVVSSYITGQTVLPKNAASIPRFYEQMKAAQRVLKQRPSGDRYVWIHTAPDHYFHAENYDMIARFLMLRFSSGYAPTSDARSARDLLTQDEWMN